MTKIIIFLCMVFISCSSPKTEKETSPVNENIVSLTDAQFQNSRLVLGKLEMKSISSTIKTTGVIDVPPSNLIFVSVALSGYLKETKLLPGMQVKKGEIIAVMEDQQYIQLQQDYLIAKSKLVYIEKEFERQKELHENKISSDKIFQQSEFEYISLKISLKSLVEKLKLINIDAEKLNENTISRTINIYSKINGYVSKVNVNIGKYISPSNVLFELIDPSHYHLAIVVFEKDLKYLAKGQKIIAYSNSDPTQKYECEIALIGQAVSNGNTTVHCHFENENTTLIPGMFMNAEISINNHDGYALPEESVVQFEGKNYVFVNVGDKKFHIIEINIGSRQSSFINITNPDSLQNKTIVIKGAYTLLMKLKNKLEE